jgi:ferric-dicitrate binding protein FerR (iron transport regulator)
MRLHILNNDHDEPSDDSDAAIYAGIDPDFVLISKRIDGSQTETERAEYDRRMTGDQKFREKALPLLAFYAMPLDLSEKLRVARAQLDAQRAAARLAGARSPAPLPLFQRPVSTLLSRRGWIWLAAASFACITVGVLAHVYDPPWSLAQPDHQAADYRTAANETRKVELPDGSFAWLLPKSRLRYDSHILKNQLVLDIDGSARIEVASDVRPIQVRKVTGYAELAAGGQYTINSLESSPKLLVTVVRGSAEMLNASGTKRVAVAVGNVGQFMSDGDIQVFAALNTPYDWRHE